MFHPYKAYKAKLESLRGRLDALEIHLRLLHNRVEHVQEALGRVETRQLAGSNSYRIADNEFRVFSQGGEDGIIQFLLRHIRINQKIFVEFGVEDYSEANTRYLLMNNKWAGLVLDSGSDNIAKIKRTRAYWHNNLKAAKAFITRDNINEILKENGVIGEIGLLSIDIDGNDFWVWRAIEAVSPIIVVIEYNHRFGPDVAVTIPYDERFNRWTTSQPVTYFGASLKALCALADQKGYAFVGCTSSGVNAFFIRKDRRPDEIRELTVREGFVSGSIRELRNEHGQIVELSSEEERQLIMSMPLVNVEEVN